ncbi:Wadjet anti-phage system protein JetD domain-containing protein [Tepidibacter mesophilus]|uniref:Wadjet anti-phage system protein JetD domain-containing protein n=1 Tax=Tepidibacter mesophilus TaxID=655607 RepID=UPI000C07020B|nr:Wadjet anti-phage system protein JetD domain-containing protein [Tepidibacter mesophilus]
MISKLKKTYIYLDEIKKIYKIEEHKETVELIKNLVSENRLKPITTSDLTPMYERIYTKYRIIKVKNEKDELDLEEINYRIHPRLNIEYYRKNIEEYRKNKEKIISLNKYLIEKSESFSKIISVNERSYEIFNDEKFINSDKGKVILKNLKIDIIKDLNVYKTPEPFIYLSINRVSPQTVLIVENKDTYITISKMLLEGKCILERKIDTIVYGEGKKIISSINGINDDITLEYLKNANNEFLYWGDIDREGFSIYSSLRRNFDLNTISLWEKPYKLMITKCNDKNLRKTPKEQKVNYEEGIETINDNVLKKEIEDILLKGRYIPQEALNMYDLEV